MKCFICNYAEEFHTTNSEHVFWSESDADNYFRTANLGQSDYSPESAYVAEHRPN